MDNFQKLKVLYSNIYNKLKIQSNLYRNIQYNIPLKGVGGLDGMSSGVVSSPVAGSKLINWGLTYRKVA